MTTFNFAFNCCCSNLLQINKHNNMSRRCFYHSNLWRKSILQFLICVCKFLCTFKIKLVLNLKTHIKMIKNVRAAVNTSVLENCYWSCNSKSLISFYISTFPYFTSAPHQRSDDGVTSKRPCCAFSAHMILTLRLRP